MLKAPILRRLARPGHRITDACLGMHRSPAASRRRTVPGRRALAPNGLGGLGEHPQLCLLLADGDGVAVHGGGKATLG